MYYVRMFFVTFTQLHKSGYSQQEQQKKRRQAAEIHKIIIKLNQIKLSAATTWLVNFKYVPLHWQAQTTN